MNARRVSAAAGVVLAAQKQRQTPAGIAAALEAAGLLQSPESAAELVALRERVAELEAALADATEPDVDGAGRTYQEYQPPARRDLRSGAEAARRMLRDRPVAEDPHDSPLHHSDAVGRDLPESGAL